jgi:ActR/RegA family two-component response regulator
VEETFLACDRNKTRTARALGINRRSLYRLLEKFEID